MVWGRGGGLFFLTYAVKIRQNGCKCSTWWTPMCRKVVANNLLIFQGLIGLDDLASFSQQLLTYQTVHARKLVITRTGTKRILLTQNLRFCQEIVRSRMCPRQPFCWPSDTTTAFHLTFVSNIWVKDPGGRIYGSCGVCV
jgi:hypothetical protein